MIHRYANRALHVLLWLGFAEHVFAKSDTIWTHLYALPCAITGGLATGDMFDFDGEPLELPRVEQLDLRPQWTAHPHTHYRAVAAYRTRERQEAIARRYLGYGCARLRLPLIERLDLRKWVELGITVNIESPTRLGV